MKTRRWPNGHRRPPPKFYGTRDNLRNGADTCVRYLTSKHEFLRYD
jgi:hypothetical protein